MGIKYHEKSCGVVLFRQEEDGRKYLILHYPSGHWDLAKGHVEEGEEELETALRELEEETGISNIDFLAGFRYPLSYKYMRKGRLSHKQVVFFLAETDQSDVQISHEHQDFQWLPYEAAHAKLTFDNAKELLAAAKKHLDG